MNPTEILKNEHRVIEQVLDCLEAIVKGCAATGKLDRQAAKDAVDFFRTFADGCHHAKEETHLFPAMEARGFARESGPVAVMLSEHEQGRAHLRAMDGAIEAASAGDPEALGRFVDHAKAYTALLRHHIEKEDHCLFPMADEALSGADQRALLEAFEKVETHAPGTHERYLAIAGALAGQYGVPHSTAPGGAPSHRGTCGCKH